MDAEQAREKTYPFDWPTPKRKPQRGKRRRKLASQGGLMTNFSQGLTIQHSKPHNAHAFDASRDGPENPIEVRRTYATLGRIFYAQIPSLWRLVRGKVRPLPVPNFRFLSPVSSRHPNALRSQGNRIKQ